ncbi:MAG: DEAD/DEAH box helicase, partial [Bradymonadaceae bacterium]
MTDEQQIRNVLPHTWHPFFGRFGRLREIQLEAVPPIVRGDDVLVGAPTASGKTEAVVAPLVERIYEHIERPSGPRTRYQTRETSVGLQLIIISPTRALCRDLGRRLERPVGDCGLSVDVKTGDSSSVAIEDDPPAVLVTTPESMDSLLARHPKGLRDVVGVVLDELHLLDGTARGDQLRCMTTRLDQVVREPLQVCGASATLPEGLALAEKYLGDGARFIQSHGDDSGQRALDAEVVEASVLEEAAEAIHQIFERGDERKLLVFANTRAQVEDLTGKLGKYESLRDRVHAHHGSLSRAERLRAETQLRDSPSAICVASMTLEVGIDVGDVDRAILLGPPPDVSSLLQRIGRSNRAEQVTRVTCLHSGHFEKLRFSHLLECAALGELFEERLPFRPSMIAQQGLSLMFQNPKNWISAEALHARLPSDGQRRWTRSDCKQILEYMRANGFYHPMEGDRFAPDEEALHQYEYGQLHTNIEDDDEVEVVDALTRQVVGQVRFYDRHKKKLRSGEDLALSLGGEKRKVVQYEDSNDQLVVRSEEGLEGAQFIASLPPRYSRGLAGDFARFLGLPAGTMLLEQVGDHWLLFHFLGTVWGRVFETMLRFRDYVKKRGTHGAFFFELDNPFEAIDQEFPTPEAVRSTIDDVLEANADQYARLLGIGPYGRWVPEKLRKQWVRDAIKPDQLAQTLVDTQIDVGTL